MFYLVFVEFNFIFISFFVSLKEFIRFVRWWRKEYLDLFCRGRRLGRYVSFCVCVNDLCCDGMGYLFFFDLLLEKKRRK